VRTHPEEKALTGDQRFFLMLPPAVAMSLGGSGAFLPGPMPRTPGET